MTNFKLELYRCSDTNISKSHFFRFGNSAVQFWFSVDERTYDSKPAIFTVYSQIVDKSNPYGVLGYMMVDERKEEGKNTLKFWPNRVELNVPPLNGSIGQAFELRDEIEHVADIYADIYRFFQFEFTERFWKSYIPKDAKDASFLSEGVAV